MNLARQLAALVLLLAGLLAPMGCISVLNEDDALTHAPYTLRNDGRITLDVMVNGKGPFVFALDSAASISALSPGSLQQLGLVPDGNKRVFIHGAVTSGKFPLVQLDTLSIGSQQWIKTSVVALPGDSRALTGIDGILGIDIMSRYAVGFLASERMILLYPPELVAHRAYRGWANIPLTARSVGDSGAFVYSIDLTIKGKRIPAIFDLGAALNMVNNAAADQFGLALKSKDRAVFAGALDSTPILANLRIATVATKDVLWRNEDFSVADLPVFEQFGMGQSPGAIVGAKLFTQRDFIIDFLRQRLLVRNSKLEHELIE